MLFVDINNITTRLVKNLIAFYLRYNACVYRVSVLVYVVHPVCIILFNNMLVRVCMGSGDVILFYTKIGNKL